MHEINNYKKKSVRSVTCDLVGSVWAHNTTIAVSGAALNSTWSVGNVAPPNSTSNNATLGAAVASNVTQYVTGVDLAQLCCGATLFGVSLRAS